MQQEMMEGDDDLDWLGIIISLYFFLLQIFNGYSEK